MADEPKNPAEEPVEAVETAEAQSQVKEEPQMEPEAQADVTADLIAELENKLADTNDQMLRMQAEMQNIRRRAQNDVERAHKFALERFVKELLPVLDSLEKAIEACGSGEEIAAPVVPLKDGVEMTLTMMLAAMKKFDVDVVDPMGEQFDPQYHEAMSMIPRDDVEPNSVIAVLQKGYVLSGRLVRPAMVMVAKS